MHNTFLIGRLRIVSPLDAVMPPVSVLGSRSLSRLAGARPVCPEAHFDAEKKRAKSRTGYRTSTLPTLPFPQFAPTVRDFNRWQTTQFQPPGRLGAGKPLAGTKTRIHRHRLDGHWKPMVQACSFRLIRPRLSPPHKSPLMRRGQVFTTSVLGREWKFGARSVR